MMDIHSGLQLVQVVSGFVLGGFVGYLLLLYIIK
jgi:hypothetical protein